MPLDDVDELPLCWRIRIEPTMAVARVTASARLRPKDRRPVGLGGRWREGESGRNGDRGRGQGYRGINDSW